MDAACAAAALVGLVFNCATAFKACNDLRGKYKNVDQTLQSIATEVSTLQLCLGQLQHLMQRDPAGLSSRWNVEPMLPQTFHTAIESFRKMILDLLRELEKINGRRSSSSEILPMRRSKFKFLWNEATMQDLLSQIRAHQQSLQFLLHILQMASISEIREGIRENRDLLRKLEISTRKLTPSHSKQSKRKSDTMGQGVSSISVDEDSDENAVGTEDEESSYSGEPPAKRRSLSPEEGGFGTTPLSPARTRSGVIFQPTISAEKAPDRNIKGPASLKQSDSSRYATQDSRNGIPFQPPLDHPSRTPAKRKSTRRSYRNSSGLGNSSSPILTERRLSGRSIPTESLIETVEADDYTPRRKHTEIGVLSPNNSIPRSRSTRSPSSTPSWWRFEILSPPSTPTRNSKTADTSQFSTRRRRHRGGSVKGDSNTNPLHEHHELPKLKTMESKNPHPKASITLEHSKSQKNTATPQHLPSAPYHTPYIESDTKNIFESESMDDIPYAMQREESSTQVPSSYSEGKPKSKVPPTLSTQKFEDKSATSINGEKSTVNPAPHRPISEKKIATDADARKHRIPPGYSLKNWDPTEEPILLLGSVFDASSLGKWIHDWTLYHHGPNTPISNLSSDLQHLVTTLFSKIKRGEDGMPHIRGANNRELIEDFIESGERLTHRLRKLLKACEEPMLKARRLEKEGQSAQRLGKSAGVEFVNTIFGEEQQLETTERFMAAIRLWNLRFDANCEEVLQMPKS
ncbi:hypothetical protein BGZ60DRAFT_560573 [Tricladium varicosporioides]|nr:hypothetical protein BGZ60DRAFT_560573 [Hymenoscyphus varicosporioides]